MRPWMTSVDGTTVTFADGSAEEFDGILFGTGFELTCRSSSDEIRSIIDLDAVHLDADRYTFHPDLPGLAFVGMWDQSGGYFVPLELQARWIAYTWGGAIPESTDAERRSAIDAYRARRGMSQKSRMNLVALTFARAAGVEPHLDGLAAPAPRLVVRSACAELFPAAGPGCVARRTGPVRAGRGRLRRDHVERADRSGTAILVAVERPLRVERRLADHLSRAQIVDLFARQPKAAEHFVVVLPERRRGQPVVVGGPRRDAKGPTRVPVHARDRVLQLLVVTRERRAGRCRTSGRRSAPARPESLVRSGSHR